MKKTFKLLSLVVLSLFIGCTDESKNPLPELEIGAFVRFTDELPPATFDEPANMNITQEIFTPDNNVTEYSLSLKAVISGTTYIAEEIFSTNTLPTNLNITSQSLSDAIGVPVSEFGFGDTFDFVATATRTDGTKFYGIGPEFDEDNLTVGIGNTESNLQGAGYNDAMAFGITISCAPFLNTDLVGTWNVTALGFAGFFNETQTTREIVAGPNSDQVTIVGGEYPTGGGVNDDLILTIDLATGTIVAVNEDGVSFGPGNTPGLATNTYLLVRGLALPCIDLIDITMNFAPFSGNPHPFVLER